MHKFNALELMKFTALQNKVYALNNCTNIKPSLTLHGCLMFSKKIVSSTSLYL